MTEVISEVTSEIVASYNSFLSSLSPFAQSFINLFLLVLVLVAYSIFVWKLYRFIATKNIFDLNLNKYNTTPHPILAKIIAGAFYFLEYIIILPFLIFFWFAIFTIFMMILAGNLEIQTILIISAVIVAAIRMTAYYKEDLSKDLAKLIPFTLLAVSILNAQFNINGILNHFSKIPTMFSQIIYYLLFIIIIEAVLRFFDFIFSLFNIEESEKEEKE